MMDMPADYLSPHGLPIVPFLRNVNIIIKKYLEPVDGRHQAPYAE